MVAAGTDDTFAYRVSFFLAALITVIGFAIEFFLMKRRAGQSASQ